MSTQTSTLEVLSEKQLQNLLTRRLKKDGYQVIQQCIDDPNQFSDIRQCRTHSMFGIDIVAQNDNQLRIIEVKGQPKGGIASSSTIFMAGIGQILTRVTQISENDTVNVILRDGSIVLKAMKIGFNDEKK